MNKILKNPFKQKFPQTLTFSFPTSIIAAMALVGSYQKSEACTGVTLRAKDGTVVFGRTMEWGTFDLNSRLVLIPNNYQMNSLIGGKDIGIRWESKYGVAGLDALEKDFLVDGMNEKGLSVNVFYHPGFAKYPKADPKKMAQTIESVDLAQFLLTSCKDVKEVKDAMRSITVVSTVEPAIGIAPPIHLIATDRAGKAVVVEFVNGELQLHDAPLGCVTNAPSYDWHITNLRNYLNLSKVALPSKKLENLDFSPLGGGSGMIGLPGDYTPPSRFVRAVAFTQSARKTNDGQETMYELFRILDNFNLPLGSAEGEGNTKLKGMRSSTIWTTGYDTKNLIFQYHTQYNRRIRQVDLKKIDFSNLKKPARFEIDLKKEQDI